MQSQLEPYNSDKEKNKFQNLQSIVIKFQPITHHNASIIYTRGIFARGGSGTCIYEGYFAEKLMFLHIKGKSNKIQSKFGSRISLEVTT